jgi:hypothetical protein
MDNLEPGAEQFFYAEMQSVRIIDKYWQDQWLINELEADRVQREPEKPENP